MTADEESEQGEGHQTASHRRERDHAISGVTPHLHRLEHAHPPELGEFALVRVEHELTRVTETGLDNRALPWHSMVCWLSPTGSAKCRYRKRQKNMRAGASC